MLGKLRNILFGQRQATHGNPEATRKQGAGHLVEDVEQKYHLLSRRFSDANGPFPGFREIYYCTKCEDYFVLAWHLRSSPLVEQCEVVPDPASSQNPGDPEPGGIFCPRCKSDYRNYGPIPHPETPAREGLRVYEAYDYPFPPDVPSGELGSISIGKLVAEKIVLFITGEFPEGFNVRDFAYAGFSDVVLDRCGGELLVSEHGGVRLHVFRTNLIVDETDWLFAFLKGEVYRKQNFGTKVFTTYGLVELKPPLRQALFCVVLQMG
jgi:hypothetical protein